MKKFINKISVFIIVLSLFACSEGDKVIDEVLGKTEIGGGVLRTISITNPIIESGVSTSKFSGIVEVQDANNSNLTEKIDIYIKFKDNNLSNGNDSKSEVLLKSIPAASFIKGNREFLYAKIEVTISEFFSKFALNSSQYSGGDVFTIRLAQIMKDGKVFTDSNTAGTVKSSAYFNSPFIYTVPVVCPITDASLFNGDYEVITDGWEDYSPGDIVPVVYDPTFGTVKFKILSTTNPSLASARLGIPYMIVTIDPTNATVKEITSFSYWTYSSSATAAQYSVTAGSGTVNSCTGDISLRVTWGTFGTYDFKLKKI
jgi:hypothetical protein